MNSQSGYLPAEKKLFYTAISYDSGSIEAEEVYTLDDGAYRRLPDDVSVLFAERNPEDCNPDQGLAFTDLASYVFSCSGAISRHILFDYLKGSFAEIESIAPLCSGDEGINIRIVFKCGDEVVEAIIRKLCATGGLGRPSIKGIPVREILGSLSERDSGSIIKNYYIAQISSQQRQETIQAIVEEIAAFNNVGPEQVSALIRNRLCGDFITHFFFDGEELDDRSEVKYGQALLSLRDRGIIHPRWVNEFELYRLTKTLFSDAVYQYRASWLGGQSLDIYVPSRKLAIEYQGLQHYQPVGYFGGKEAFDCRQDLDAKKAALCESHNVKLYCWDYRIPVSTHELKCVLAEMGIIFPYKDMGCRELFDQTPEKPAFNLTEEICLGEKKEHWVFSLGEGDLKRLLLDGDYVKNSNWWQKQLISSELVAVPGERGYRLIGGEEGNSLLARHGAERFSAAFEYMCAMALGIRIPLLPNSIP